MLNDVLDKFYAEETKKITLQVDKTQLERHILNSLPIEWFKIVAYSIWSEYFPNINEEDRLNFLNSFIEGMHLADQRKDALFFASLGYEYDFLSRNEYFQFLGFKTWAHYKAGGSFFTLPQVIQSLQDIQKHGNLLDISKNS